MPRRSLERRKEFVEALKDPELVRARQGLVNHYLLDKAGIKSSKVLTRLGAEAQTKLDEQFSRYSDWRRVLKLNSEKLSVDEISEKTGVPPTTVFSWVRRGVKPVVLKWRNYAHVQESEDFAFLAGLYTLNGHPTHLRVSFNVESDVWKTTQSRLSSMTKKIVLDDKTNPNSHQIFDPDLALALHKATRGRSDLPEFVWHDDQRALEYIRGLFHGGGTFSKPVNSKVVKVNLQLGDASPAFGERLCVLLYSRLGLLPTLSVRKSKSTYLSFAHEQDIEVLVKNNLLKPGDERKVGSVPPRIKKKNQSIDVDAFETALHLSMSLTDPREIGRRIGVNPRSIANWKKTAPLRAFTYAKVVDYARRHELPFVVEYPSTYIAVQNTIAHRQKAK